MRHSLVFVGLVSLLGGCSGNSTNGGTTGGGTTGGGTTGGGTTGATTGGGTTGGGTTTAGTTGGGTTGGGPTPDPFTVSIGPFSLASGMEIVKCAIVKIPTTVATDVVNIKTTLLPGSHHLILYRTDATAEKAPYDCTSFAGVFGGDAPVFIAESAASEMQLPAAAAYRFTAGQLVLLEAHYINTTQQTISAKGTVTLTPGKTGTYQAADIMMCGSYLALQCGSGGGIPAGQMDYALPVGFYNGNGIGIGGSMKVDLTPLKFFAFTSHEHHRGSEVKIWRATSTNISTATQIYDNMSWDNPPLTVLPDNQLLTFGAGEGFAWQCHYDSSADSQKVCFGESADAEMCFIWAYYYPSVGRFIATNDCWAN